MADFINTIDLLGDEAVASTIIDRTITEFNDDVITMIGHSTFYGCASLTSVSLPNVTTVDANAFYNCKALASISLPKVTSIGGNGFRYCEKLQHLYLPATPPNLYSTNAFNGVYGCTIHIPAGSLDAYKSATNWSTLTGQYTFQEDA